MKNCDVVEMEDSAMKERRYTAGDTSELLQEKQNVAVRMALFALRFYKAYLSILFAGSAGSSRVFALCI